jgi:hypothetical protein
MKIREVDKALPTIPAGAANREEASGAVGDPADERPEEPPRDLTGVRAMPPV